MLINIANSKQSVKHVSVKRITLNVQRIVPINSGSVINMKLFETHPVGYIGRIIIITKRLNTK